MLNTLLRGCPQIAAPSSARKAYTLALIGVITALAVMDRNILSILLVPIQKEIKASDTAMGLLSGLAFALFYATAAIPLSRVADKGNRRSLLVAALAVWSAATAVCGLARSFGYLLLARIGVASGEAASYPATMSMIADLYPPGRRAAALSVTLMGNGVGVMVGAILGGLLADRLGWRSAFVYVGLPGMLLALLIWLTVPEPVRTASKPEAESESFGRTLKFLSGSPALRNIILARCFVQVGAQSSQIWFPAYLVRVQHLSLTRTGLYYGTATAVATVLAALIAGAVADRLGRRGEAWYLGCSAAAMLLCVPITAALVVVPNAGWAAVVMFLYSFASSLNNAPTLAAALAIVKPRMWGTMTAIMNLVMNLAGFGLGGFLIGRANDLLAPRFGTQAIRYSLLMLPVAVLIAALFFLLGMRTVARDARRAEA